VGGAPPVPPSAVLGGTGKPLVKGFSKGYKRSAAVVSTHRPDDELIETFAYATLNDDANSVSVNDCLHSVKDASSIH